jgi:hypothetical protein
MLPWGATIGTLRILADQAGVVGQPLHPKLTSHHIADPDHFIFDVVDILSLTIQTQRLFLRQHLRH